MVAIFPPHGAKIPDAAARLEIAGSVPFAAKRKKRDMRGGCHRFLTSLAFQIRRKKALYRRCYCQNVLSGLEESDTGFNPTKRALDRADRQFELLGAEATFQGSALKLEDAPKLRLPEVMSFFKDTRTACYWLLRFYRQVNHGEILGNRLGLWAWVFWHSRGWKRATS